MFELKEVLRFEAALAEAAANGATPHVALPDNIDAMLAEIAAGQLPGAPRTTAIFEIGVAPEPFVRLLEEAVTQMATRHLAFVSFNQDRLKR